MMITDFGSHYQVTSSICKCVSFVWQIFKCGTLQQSLNNPTLRSLRTFCFSVFI